VADISPHKPPIDQIRQYAFHFIQIHINLQPPNRLHNTIQRQLMLLQNAIHPFEKIPMTDGLTLLQQKIRSPLNELILILQQSLMEGLQISSLYREDERDVFDEVVLLQ